MYKNTNTQNQDMHLLQMNFIIYIQTAISTKTSMLNIVVILIEMSAVRQSDWSIPVD